MSERFDLSGRVALVTGAGNGIGKRLAKGLAEAGAEVVVADIDGAAALEVAAPIGGMARVVNVTDPASVEALFAAIDAQYGRIDVVVNNAGGGGGNAPTLELKLADWQAGIDLTLTSTFLCAQQAGRRMVTQGGGKIINVASVYGMVGHESALYDLRPDGEPPESLTYLVTKAGVINLTRGLAVYWAKHNIQVNAIAPGMVKTERLGQQISEAAWDRLAARTPMGRPANPDELVGATIFLASDASSFITGQTLVIDGGWTSV
ncbi:MAG: SDR family oxidoreductase [Thermomicrobiales bacterium]|nr:SDR family oxidoreductase [Thermomicrobiales bacterium]